MVERRAAADRVTTSGVLCFEQDGVRVLMVWQPIEDEPDDEPELEDDEEDEYGTVELKRRATRRPRARSIHPCPW
jgi:hypothetical protein